MEMENELTEQKQGFFKGFISDWKKVFLKPKDFFAETTMEYGKALKFAGINILVYSIGSILITQLLGKTALLSPIMLLPFFLLMFVGSFLGLFIGAAVLHCFFKLFGGKGNYKQTLGIEAYSFAMYAITWIPFVGLIGFYALYIAIRGGEVKHNLSLGKSIVAVIAPMLLALIFFVIAIAIPNLMRVANG